MTRYAMGIDLGRCTGCQTCVVACQQHHALRPGVAWCTVDTLEWGRWPEADRTAFPHACLHCDDPFCVRVCPTGASFKREDGAVAIDEARCIGCGVCLTACPYGARTINRTDTWHFGAATPAPYESDENARLGVAEKCTFCVERLAEGRHPACVEHCPMEARVFGDLDDPASPISRFIAETASEHVPATSVYYATATHPIDLERTITTHYYAPATESGPVGERVGEGNPAVVAAAGVAAVALATGAGLTAKKNRDRRAQRAAEQDKE